MIAIYIQQKLKKESSLLNTLTGMAKGLVYEPTCKYNTFSSSIM